MKKIRGEIIRGDNMNLNDNLIPYTGDKSDGRQLRGAEWMRSDKAPLEIFSSRLLSFHVFSSTPDPAASKRHPSPESLLL